MIATLSDPPACHLFDRFVALVFKAVQIYYKLAGGVSKYMVRLLCPLLFTCVSKPAHSPAPASITVSLKWCHQMSSIASVLRRGVNVAFQAPTWQFVGICGRLGDFGARTRMWFWMHGCILYDASSYQLKKATDCPHNTRQTARGLQSLVCAPMACLGSLTVGAGVITSTYTGP